MTSTTQSLDSNTSSPAMIHIHLTKRKWKILTIIYSLFLTFFEPSTVALKAIKTKFCCSSDIVIDSEVGEVVRMHGDQWVAAKEFLIEKGLDEGEIEVRNFEVCRERKEERAEKERWREGDRSLLRRTYGPKG